MHVYLAARASQLPCVSVFPLALIGHRHRARHPDVEGPRRKGGGGAAEAGARGREGEGDILPVLAGALADDAEIAEGDGAFAAEHAGVVAGHPARAGHGVGERDGKVAGLGGGHAHGHGLVAAAAGTAQLVELVLRGGDFVLQVLALLIERGALGDDPRLLLGQVGERIRELRQVGPRYILGRRGEERGFHPVEHDALRLEDAVAVVEAAQLLLQPAEGVLELLHPGIGREVDVGLLAGDIEDGRLGRALAADLERLLVEGLGQVGEDQLRDPADQLDAGGAGDGRCRP